MCCTVTKKSAIWSSKMEQDRSSVVSPRLPARTPTPVAAVNLLKFIVNHNDYVLCLCTTACIQSILGMTEKWRVVMYNSISIFAIHERLSYHKSFFYASSLDVEVSEATAQTCQAGLGRLRSAVSAHNWWSEAGIAHSTGWRLHPEKKNLNVESTARRFKKEKRTFGAWSWPLSEHRRRLAFGQDQQ